MKLMAIMILNNGTELKEDLEKDVQLVKSNFNQYFADTLSHSVIIKGKIGPCGN